MTALNNTKVTGFILYLQIKMFNSKIQACKRLSHVYNLYIKVPPSHYRTYPTKSRGQLILILCESIKEAADLTELLSFVFLQFHVGNFWDLVSKYDRNTDMQRKVLNHNRSVQSNIQDLHICSFLTLFPLATEY